MSRHRWREGAKRRKIAKLREMTVERGCSPPEAATARQMADELESALGYFDERSVGAGTPGDLCDYACPGCGATVEWLDSETSLAPDAVPGDTHGLMSVWRCGGCGLQEGLLLRLRYWDEATNDGYRFPMYRGGREVGYIEVLVKPETRGRRCGRCRGTGCIAWLDGTADGYQTSVTSTVCSACAGTGRIGDEPVRTRHRVGAGSLPPWRPKKRSRR